MPTRAQFMAARAQYEASKGRAFDADYMGRPSAEHHKAAYEAAMQLHQHHSESMHDNPDTSDYHDRQQNKYWEAAQAHKAAMVGKPPPNIMQNNINAKTVSLRRTAEGIEVSRKGVVVGTLTATNQGTLSSLRPLVGVGRIAEERGELGKFGKIQSSGQPQGAAGQPTQSPPHTPPSGADSLAVDAKGRTGLLKHSQILTGPSGAKYYVATSGRKVYISSRKNRF